MLRVILSNNSVSFPAKIFSEPVKKSGMATTERFQAYLKILALSSKVVGLEIWTAPGKLRPASYYLSFHVIVYFLSSIYTLAKYSNDPLHQMKVLITFGTAVQLYTKFFVGIRNGSKLKEFTDLLEEQLLKPFQCGSPEEVAVLQRTGRILWIIFRLMSTGFMSTGVVFGLYPLFAYYANGVVMPPFLCELPYYGWSTTAGYVANMLFQVNLYVLGIVGATIMEFLFIMYALYALAYAEIFMVHLRELEKLLNDPEAMEKDASIMYQKWRQCMYDHQQSVRFLNSVEELFKLIFLVQVGSGFISICDGMLLVLLTDWYAAYFFLMVIFFDLSMYFVVGHYVELKVDEMYETINAIPWYKMPVRNQKEFSFLLCRQQRPLILTIYGFAPLNFATYTSVLRGFYQIFVMLMQYVV